MVASAADEDEDAATEAQKHIHNGLKYAPPPSPSGRSQEPDITQQEAGPTAPVISTLWRRRSSALHTTHDGDGGAAGRGAVRQHTPGHLTGTNLAKLDLLTNIIFQSVI